MTQPKPKSVGGALLGALLYMLAALLMIPFILAGFVGATYLIIWSVRTFGALGLVYVIGAATLAVVFGSVYSALRNPPAVNARARRIGSSQSNQSGGRGRWVALGFLLGRGRGN